MTRAARDVLLTQHTFRGRGGAAWPSHATLADRARCCTKTVQRAQAQAQGLGLVSWAERRVRAGWRWLRTSNRYRFGVPEGAVQAAPSHSPRPPVFTTGHCDRGGESREQERGFRRAAAGSSGGGSGPAPAASTGDGGTAERSVNGRFRVSRRATRGTQRGSLWSPWERCERWTRLADEKLSLTAGLPSQSRERPSR